MSRRFASFLAAFLLFFNPALSSRASAEGLSLIRDAEIEHTIRAYATPLFQAAGLTASHVRILLVRDRSLNAFVAGGQNLFVHTGLLRRSEHAGQIIGVLAHETGHISGGHIARMGEAVRNANIQNIATMLLGIAGALATGRPDLVVAGNSAANQIATRGFLTYTRTQESSADAAALTFLDATGQSSRGLEEFYSILSGQELLLTTNQDPYVRTHPLTRERMEVVSSHLKRSRFADARPSPEFEEMHARMVAKLDAFIDAPLRTLRNYPHGKQDLANRYARAIAYYRNSDLDNALPLIDGLINERPADPYFYELKGQMLYEHGQLEESLPSYRNSVRYAPDSALLRIALAQNLIGIGRQTYMEEAVQHLEYALRIERTNHFGWRQLGIAEGRLGNFGKADLALAEAAAIRGDKEEMRYKSRSAVEALPRNSAAWLRAQDLLQEAERE